MRNVDVFGKINTFWQKRDFFVKNRLFWGKNTASFRDNFAKKRSFVKNCQFKTSARSVKILLKKIDSIELITA